MTGTSQPIDMDNVAAAAAAAAAADDLIMMMTIHAPPAILLPSWPYTLLFMGLASLFSRCNKTKTNTTANMMLYKLVVLGDGGVGKTALTIQLCLNHFVETYDPTIEDSYRKQVVIDDQPCVLEVLDTAGQEEYTALRDQWIRDGEGFLLVYSITSRSTFDRIERFRDQIFRVKDVDNVPLMLVGNKCDKVTERDVHREEGYAMAKRLACDFIETSAKTCVNVERSFYQVVKTIRAQREGLRAGTKSKPKKDKKSKCLIL